MLKIILCLFTLVALGQGSAYHFYLTSHPNMIEYLKRMTPEKTEAAKHPSLSVFCKMLKESRIFKAIDPTAPNFKVLQSDWELLLNFTDPSLVMEENSSLQELNIHIKNEIGKLGEDRQYNAQLLCFKSLEYHYYLVFNWGDIIPDYDKLLVVHHVKSVESAILGLVQMHIKGSSRDYRLNDPFSPINLEAEYLWAFSEKRIPLEYKLIKKETFCSMEKYHLLNYCSRSLNYQWDMLEHFYVGFPEMTDPSIINSVEIWNCNCIQGEVILPAKKKDNVPTVFLPCTIYHERGLKTYFHLTPSTGLFLAKNTDEKNYMLYGAIINMEVTVKNVDGK